MNTNTENQDQEQEKSPILPHADVDSGKEMGSDNDEQGNSSIKNCIANDESLSQSNDIVKTLPDRTAHPPSDFMEKSGLQNSTPLKRGGRKLKSHVQSHGLQDPQSIPQQQPDLQPQVDDKDGAEIPDTVDNEASSYSDIDSQDPDSPRRRYQRGGRKSTNTIPRPPSDNLEVELLEHSQKVLDHTQEEPKASEGNDYDNEQLKKARTRSEHSRRAGRRPSLGSRTGTGTGTGSKPKRPGFGNRRTETGIRSFNMKRAEESGGGRRGSRPFGVTLERPKSYNTGGGARKKSEVESEKGNRRSEKNNLEGEVEDDGQQEEDQEDTEKDERKCVSIRLDLNLEIEIFLKAKIKGDVTITFL